MEVDLAMAESSDQSSILSRASNNHNIKAFCLRQVRVGYIRNQTEICGNQKEKREKRVKQV